MLSRYNTIWAILFGPLILFVKGKPKPVKAESFLPPKKLAENEPTNSYSQSEKNQLDDIDEIDTRFSITDRRLSARLFAVSSSNTPKARAVKRQIRRSTLSRPAPVMRAKTQHKKRSIGPITWPVYKGRTAISSKRIAMTPKRSAQILRLPVKTTTCRRRASNAKSSVRGLARAA